MSNDELNITIFNVETGQLEQRPFTGEELANYEATLAAQVLVDSQNAAKQEARTSALAKLAALGLTEEEIAAL